MSSQYLNSLIPNKDISLKVFNAKFDGAITHGNIPNANVVQSPSITTAIDATAVTNPYNFNVATAIATTAAGDTEIFFLNMPPSFLNSYGFGSISAYYYGGVVGTAGTPVLSIITQESNRVTFILENKHASNALNGSIHFRWKYELGEVGDA